MAFLIPVAAAVAGSVISNQINKSGSRTPQLAEVRQPSTVDQADQLYDQSQDVLKQQQNFTNAAMQASPDVFQQQQALSNMLTQQAQGQGPNPALAQLANSTGQNAQQQAALMASQRGAGANAGLIARQAAMQGANINQQGAGQAAVLQAQQQLASQQQLGQQQAQIASQQQNALQGLNQFTQGAQGLTLNSIASQNQANVGSMSSANGTGASMAGTNAQLGAGLAGGIGAALGQGGVKKMATGGMVDSGPCSSVGQRMKAGGKVPGEAKVSGNSLKNDTVSAKLSPGEIVIPRSIAQGKNAPERAAEFVRHVLAGKDSK